MPTPEEDVIERLSVPLACGWKDCFRVFGFQPLPYPYGSKWEMKGWEDGLRAHDYAFNHPYRKLREVGKVK